VVWNILTPLGCYSACKPGEYEEHTSGHCRYQYNAIYSWGSDISGEFGLGISTAEPVTVSRSDNETIVSGSDSVFLTDAGNVYFRYGNDTNIQKFKIPFKVRAVTFSETFLAQNGSIYACYLSLNPTCFLQATNVKDMSYFHYLTTTGYIYQSNYPSPIDVRAYSPKKVYSPIYINSWNELYLGFITDFGDLYMMGSNMCTFLWFILTT
jgi:hypothetical protein